MMALPVNRRRISGRHLSPPEKYSDDGQANQSSRIAYPSIQVLIMQFHYTGKSIVTSLKVLFIRNKVKVALLLLQLQNMTAFMSFSLHARESGLWNPRNLCLWNPEFGALEPGIQLKESRIPLTIGIQNPRLSSISFYGVA